MKKTFSFLLELIIFIMFLLSYLAFFSANWYITTYGNLGFDSIIFTILSSLSGVERDLLLQYAVHTLFPTILFTAITFTTVFFMRKKKPQSPWKQKSLFILSTFLILILFVSAGKQVGFFRYIAALSQQTTIYEEYYVEPESVEISFPNEKQNLIYIYLESMETTFFDQKEGGALNKNVIPCLYNLAKNNINFSHNNSVGGFTSVNGTTWTIGAMVAHTAGIPLKFTSQYNYNDYGKTSFLPGVVTIMDLLKKEGYYQALMVGSDASFANRDQFYSQHGVDKIYDLFTAWEDNIVENGQYVWWGITDEDLYRYAKQELPRIASENKPFSFTMLTVDTHHVDGYYCESCNDEYIEQYENVLSCADKQLNDFISWLKEQDFYDNTTIVITGDHLTMDAQYISRNVDNNFSRHVYNCFINAKTIPVISKNRIFCAMDMFPTTLSAMGCTIKGDRLGLGTNLFSNKKTLSEELGDKFEEELTKDSQYYILNFMFNE